MKLNLRDDIKSSNFAKASDGFGCLPTKRGSVWHLDFPNHNYDCLRRIERSSSTKKEKEVGHSYFYF